MSVRAPLIGKEGRNALGASGTEAWDDEGNPHGSLAAQEPEPDVDRVIGVMRADAFARREPEAAGAKSRRARGG